MVANSPAEADTVESLATTARPLLIAGEPVPGAEVSRVEFPYDGREIGRAWLADAPLLERAIAAADGARKPMAALPPHARAEVLGRAAELVRDRGEELAVQMTLETGNAIINLTRQLSLELCDRNINVNAIGPGVTNTQIFDKMGFPLSEPANLQAYLDIIPAGRLAEPSEIAASVAFLAADDAAYVHGQTLFVDGGYTSK